jgi:hypothetical protein
MSIISHLTLSFKQQLTTKRRSAWEGSFELFDATQACQYTSRVTRSYKEHILVIFAGSSQKALWHSLGANLESLANIC